MINSHPFTIPHSEFRIQMIPAGELRHRITIQKPPTARDSRGLKTGDWTDVGNASASITELTGTERDLARQMFATTTHRIQIRYRRNFAVTTKQRISFRGRLFEIGHVGNVDQVNCLIPCLCAEEKP